MSNWEDILNFKRGTDEIFRILCFSSEEASDTDQILLWSHYSKNHRGIRIHFNSEFLETSRTKLYKVDYTDERAQLDYTLDEKSRLFMKQLEKSFYTKSKAWKYEKEYRLFVDPEICQKKEVGDTFMYFVKIPIRSIVRVDLGAFCNKPHVQDTEILKELSHYKNVQFYKATLDEEKYKLNYEMIN